jgi:hypothetical protein
MQISMSLTLASQEMSMPQTHRDSITNSFLAYQTLRKWSHTTRIQPLSPGQLIRDLLQE